MSPHSHTRTEEITLQTPEVTLEGSLAVPDQSRGLVLFAHGSGSSRFSPRNQFVAGALNQAGLATLLFDLLTADEHERDAYTAHLRFDIALLARRLTEAVDWVGRQETLRAMTIGLFGASTGAAAALVTAAERPEAVGAVVSRGGRPDLAREALPRVKAPTLLIVGGLDTPVIGMNQEAAQQMHAENRIEIVPGASHLFEEPGKLEEVARLAAGWFTNNLLSPTNKSA